MNFPCCFHILRYKNSAKCENNKETSSQSSNKCENFNEVLTRVVQKATVISEIPGSELVKDVNRYFNTTATSDAPMTPSSSNSFLACLVNGYISAGGN